MSLVYEQPAPHIMDITKYRQR